jgi:4'-phosphopantetheinyl transferase
MLPGPDAVLVSRIRLDEQPVAVPLDEDERRRAARFVFDIDRRRYVAAHTALRVILGRFLGQDPADLRFTYGPRGKPRLADAPIDARFNLSHSGDLALVAVAIGREVGVDIDQTRTMSDMSGVAEHAFSPAERALLERTPPESRPEVFFRIWTRKESFIKALGDGMHFPLDGFDVSAEPTGSQLLLACRAAPHELGRWTTRAVACEPGFTAAITVEGDGFEMRSIAYAATGSDS